MSPLQKKSAPAGFTLIELLVVLSVIAILAGLLLPSLIKAQGRGQGISCINNTRQLALAIILYAADEADYLPYNLGMNGSSFRTNANWVNNVMTWDLSSDNTNILTIADASLGRYTSGNVNIFRCPSDHVLSAEQRVAGWSGRVRSYSLNALIGDAGAFSSSGQNVNNPGYIQFFKTSDIPKPSEIFTFLDEHPDSIDDGYFVNNYAAGNYSANVAWIDLPASYHNNSTALSFADGHSELHHWTQSGTSPPSRPNAANLPLDVPANARADYYWTLRHMSVQN